MAEKRKAKIRKDRGQEHGGKAEGEEKAQKSQIRKTCVAW